MKKLLSYLVLPPAVSPFEAAYLRRINRVALCVFALHPPVFALVAYWCGTSVMTALALSGLALMGPILANIAFVDRPRAVGLVTGVTAMLMGGILVYLGQGPMQIEMHFYFFVMIPLLAVYGNPLVIVVGAATVAIHHVTMWLVLPSGVFNYAAPLLTIFVHAIFVLIEAIAACFVARSFFDNVIGLEKIVAARTEALDARNQDMARILDNAAQGFVSVDLQGAIGGEWSRALEVWFGAPTAGMRLWDYLYRENESRDWMRISFESLVDGFLPIQLALEQLPRRIKANNRELQIDYLPIGTPLSNLLVVVSDVTSEIARERSEQAQRELAAVIERAISDRAGFTSFMDEAGALVERCVGSDLSRPELRRIVHTLKGNCALFGVSTIAALCHAVENEIADRDEVASTTRDQLIATWNAFRDRVERVLGRSERPALVVDLDEYKRFVAGIPSPTPMWAHGVREWANTPARPRLEQCASYARMLAAKLGKTDLNVVILDHDVPDAVGTVRGGVDQLGARDSQRRRSRHRDGRRTPRSRQAGRRHGHARDDDRGQSARDRDCR
ncbi:MAG: Hpt domain-containing protein [Kofleriaceae bacterium]